MSTVKMFSRRYRTVMKKIGNFVDKITAPFWFAVKKMFSIIFIISFLYIFWVNKFYLKETLCRSGECERTYDNVFYFLLTTFIILLYVIIYQSTVSLFFYSPFLYVFRAINRIDLDLRLGFNILFVLFTSFVTIACFAFLYINGMYQKFVSLLRMDKKLFALAFLFMYIYVITGFSIILLLQ